MRIFGIRLWDVEHITRGDNKPYLYRIGLFRCKLFSILFHRFFDSDDECLHDHPWAFISLILTGGYYERDKNNNLIWYGPGTFLRRPANWAHQVVLKPGIKPITLVITSEVRRRWGFHTPFGWKHWREYNKGLHCS